MFETISESEEIRQDPAECEETFTSLKSGDTVLLTAWGGDEYVKAEFEVTSTNHDTTASDDTVSGTVNGESAKLRLPWRPAEPNVGIPNAYSEGPIQFTFDGETFDVSSLQKQ